MKQFFVSLVTFTLIFVSISVNAQAPWQCSGRAIGTYNPVGNSYTDNTKLYSAYFDKNGNVTYANKTATSGVGLNGIGFRKQDNFVYGVRYTKSNGSLNELCRIDSTGSIVSLGTISGLRTDVQYFAGGFDSKGYLYVSTGSGSTPYYLYKIDVTTRTATNLGSIGSYRLVDMAFDPLTDSLYATSSNTNSDGGDLLKIDITKNPLTISNRGTMNVFMFGLFFLDGSQLYGFGRNTDNTTNYFKINKTTAGLTVAGAGPSATNADACSCPFRLSHTLSAAANCVNPGQDTTLTVAITNLSSASQNATFDLTLDKRLSFTASAAQIQANIQSLFPGSTAVVTLSNDNGGVNNKISVNTIAVPVTTAENPAIPFDLSIKIKTASFTLGETISFQSTIDVPGNNLSTGSDLSDNPLTAQLDDATTLTICLPQNGPLPVTLTDFKGDVNQNNVKLSWTTRQEINTHSFEIERSYNGTDFEKAGEINANGNSSVSLNYHFDDNSIPSGATVYYRLKMIDKDGNFTYSQIVVLKLAAVKGQTLIYPSPFVDKIAVNTYVEERGMLTITLLDATGRKVLNMTSGVEKGNNTLTLNNLSNLQKGIYYINILNGASLIESRKIIKIQ